MKTKKYHTVRTVLKTKKYHCPHSSKNQKIPHCPHSSKNQIEKRYNWNIVESGVKHHNPNPNPIEKRYNWNIVESGVKHPNPNPDPIEKLRKEAKWITLTQIWHDRWRFWIGTCT